MKSHLLGKETIGVYPLLPDETCWFLAVDFDKNGQEDSIAFMDTCREMQVPAALERSRSGKGGHVWIFFERAVPPIIARKLGCAILTRTMERRHQLGLNSYDRFFPSQDTMPKGGFGNLIALPLSSGAAESRQQCFHRFKLSALSQINGHFFQRLNVCLWWLPTNLWPSTTHGRSHRRSS
ncbi:MAG: hypothetical protein JO159_17670 [Acidobacteria bacterium]|nr:hypothetical protein [Acidobacteriota bacterium]